MNNTEFKSIEISKEEIEAVQRYISSAHTGMNILLDLDPQMLAKLSSKGWLIELSKENIEENTEYLSRVYSAMYKYSKQHSHTLNLYRGSTIDELKKLEKENVSGRFMSTTTDENIAMRFTEYKNGALFTINANEDVPFINANEFLDETQVAEDEILLAPFNQVDSIQKYSVQDIEGVTRYNVTLSKKEFENISAEERQINEKIINAFDFDKGLSEYSDLVTKLDIMTSRIEKMGTPKTNDEREELSHMRQKQVEMQLEINEVMKRFNVVRQAMQTVLQDKFKTVELEIDKELNKELKEKQEEERQRKIQEERKRKESLMDDAEKLILQMDSVKLDYSTMDSEEQTLFSKTHELGINKPDIERQDPQTLEKFEQLKQNIEKIKRDIVNLEIPDDLTTEEMAVSGEINQKINELHSKLAATSKVLEECSKAVFEQKGKNKALMGREVATSIGNSIFSKIKGDLLREEEILMSKKDNLWDKITGKSKIRAAQVENLKLKRQFVEKGGLELPDNIEQIQEYVTKYATILGRENLPDDAKKMLTQQPIEVQLTEQEKMLFETVSLQSGLVPVGKTRKQILHLLEEQNNGIEEKIQNINSSKDNKTVLDLEQRTKNNVERCLDTAIFYTSELSEEQKKSIMRDLITL